MGLYHGWSDEPDTHADFVRGGVPIEDFEPKVKHKKKRQKKSKKPGCPENNGGRHIYVWVPEGKTSLFYRFYGFYKWEREVCCGCEKTKGSYWTHKGRRWTEKYREIALKRWEKTHSRGQFRSFRWENEDKDYREFKERYIRRYGFSFWDDFW